MPDEKKPKTQEQPAEGGGSQATAEKAKPSRKFKPKKLPPYNVVLLDDNDHSYDYVIDMLASVFGHPAEKGFQLAKEVDETGRVICMTTHKELAELKRDQIVGFGADPRIAKCKTSMQAIVEPAEG